MPITQEDIKAKLLVFGFRKGDRIMVHSSLRSFGHVVGGAEAVIKALIDVVGETGIIMMPSFNHGAPFSPNGSGIFDPKETPTTNGKIPDTFWRIKGVFRSLNPTHAFSAWGKDAERYTKDHHLTLTMGEESPLGMIALDGGYQINFGTTHGTTTAKHLAETINRSPCLGYRTEEYPVRLPDGSIAYHRTWGWRESACPITDSGEYIEIEMEKQKLQKKGYIGDALVTYFRLWNLIKVIFDMLDNGYAGFPPCSKCSIRPRAVAETRPSDWKEKCDPLMLKMLIKEHKLP
ncbi:TPA: AAC(3) family N-acetyltransferase [bacterium]|nr:AAC(3) family N-acetyltransferase [bacterium]